MDLKQRIQDISLLLQRDRKAQLVAVGLGCMVLFLMFGGDSTPRRQVAQAPKPAVQGNAGRVADEAYDDLLRSFSEDLNAIKSVAEQNSEDTRELRQNMMDYEQRTAEIFKKILERVNEQETVASTSYQDQYPAPVEVGDQELAPIEEEVDELEAFGDVTNPEVAPPPVVEPTKLAMVGAGDSVRVELLAGVNAPTDGTPYPVVFKLIDAIHGPDGSELPVGEARIIAAAQGSLSDQRALFRLTSLNVRLPNGERKVMDVDGWIVGEDGVRGMSGILIDPIGKLVGAAAFGGALEGLGEGFAESELDRTTNTDGSSTAFVSGNVGQYAAAQAGAGAASAWNNLIQQRANLLVPHVRVLSGREGTAVFSKSFQIKGLFEQLEDDESVFGSLD